MKQINTIKGLEDIRDYYLITTCGKVISTFRDKVKVLNPSKDGDGYMFLYLRTKDNKSKMMKIHRLVAMAFIPNTDNKKEVNHLDENKEHNYVQNLGWCTRKENINHGTRNERSGESQKGSKNHKSKSKEYYTTHSTTRGSFKIICERQEWQFNNFEETFVEYYVSPNGQKIKKYIYIEK